MALLVNFSLRQSSVYLRVGLSFITPRTIQDLERRRTMMTHWARVSCGMMDRTPDFMHVTIMAMAVAGDYFAQNRPGFKANIRENDLVLTHTLVSCSAAGVL